MIIESTYHEAGKVGKTEGSIIPLTSSEIHVWLTFYEAIIEEPLLVAYRELLNAKEREEESRFRFASDRHRYLVTRALVRTALSHYACVDPKDWAFATNAYGQPRIVNTQEADGRLSFSVSHTQGLIVLGVARSRSLGIDVENFATRNISFDIACHCLARQEAAALRELPHQQQQYRFFEYWTFRESYIKARGMGFCLPLDSFTFHFADDHTVDLAIKPELRDDSSRWQLWQIRPTPEHLLALCAEKISAQPPKLIFRETIPTVSESMLTPERMRTPEMRH